MKAKRKPDRKAADVRAFPKSAKIASDDDDAPRSMTQLAALQRIGVTQEQLDAAPQITPLLKQAHGGIKQVMAAMRMMKQDQTIAAYLYKYDSIPGWPAACPGREVVRADAKCSQH